MSLKRPFSVSTNHGPALSSRPIRSQGFAVDQSEREDLESTPRETILAATGLVSASLEANENRNDQIMNTNGDLMMPMMQLGIGMMNVFNDYDEMTIMFKMTMRTDMTILIMIIYNLTIKTSKRFFCAVCPLGRLSFHQRLQQL